MNAREIIERIARLDEAPLVEPEVEPGIDEPTVEPVAPPRPRPGREPAPDPFDVPPNYTPDTFPPGKAEDESEEIEAWLEATQQPIQDWEWDGESLRLLLDDGTIETYTRQQLDEIGVFGSMAFAEALEIPPFGAENDEFGPGNAPADFGEHGTGAILDQPGPTDGEFGDLGAPGEPGLADEEGEPRDAVIQGILGTEEVVEPEPIEVTGEPAERLGQAISDVVSAILGIVGQGAEGAPAEAPTGGPEKGESDSEKPEPEKKDGGPKKDKTKDKEPDKKKDDKKDDKGEKDDE